MNIKLRRLQLILPAILAMAVLFFPLVTAAAPLADADAWTPVAQWIDFQKFTITNSLNRPVEIYVARMARVNPADPQGTPPNVIVDSAIGQGKLSEGRESVQGMAARYNGAINYWGEAWGKRNRVAVAINGFLFDEFTGVPTSGQVQSGWYAKRFTDNSCTGGFVWKLSRYAGIGDCITHNPTRNFIQIIDTNPIFTTTLTIEAINIARTNEEVILYTPQWDAATSSDNPSVEILVQLDRPAMVLPKPSYAQGTIRLIREATGNPLPFDYVVIAAWGAAGQTILDNWNAGKLNKGDQVRISQEIENLKDSPNIDWRKSYAAVGGDYHFLSDGVLRTTFGGGDWNVPNSRTAVALNADYVYFVVADCFDRDISAGLSVPELGQFVVNQLTGIIGSWGVTMDSGGSSQMVVNGQVVNNASGNNAVICGQVNGLVEQIPEGTGTGVESEPDSALTPAQPEAPSPVANALMMVVVEDKVNSTTFLPDDTPGTLAATDLLLGPGTNYAPRLSVPSGKNVTILAEQNSLNGVRAKSGLTLGSYWWYVDYNGTTGWVREETLTGGIVPSVPDAVLFLPNLLRASTP